MLQPRVIAAMDARANAAPRGLSLPLAMAVLVFVLGLVSAGARLADPDVMLHIVTGRWIIAHHALPRVDMLSYTMAGAPWVAHEWLGEVVTALVYDALGWQGLVAMASLALAAAVAIYARALLGYYQPAHVVIITAAAWFVLTPHWLARPHMLALPFLVAWMAVLVRARQTDRAPPRVAVLLLIPWVNLHATFLVGIGFAGLFAVEAVLLAKDEAQRLTAARRWGGFIVLALLATLISPNFIDSYRLPLRLLDMKFALSVLQEWKSVDFQTLSPLELWLLLFLGAVLFCGVRLSPSRALMTLLLFAMGLQHARNADLLVFVAPLIAAPDAAPLLAARGRAVAARAASWLERMARPASARGMAFAVLIAAAAEAVAASFPVTPGDAYMPAAAIAAARAHGLDGPVLNEYDFGDYLLFRGIKTFIDGRADMYGDAFIKRYYNATRGLSADLPALIVQYHVTWTIFPKDAPAVIQLDRLPGWHRLYQDGIAVIHVRDSTGPN
jgi:hypothetical protein